MVEDMKKFWSGAFIGSIGLCFGLSLAAAVRCVKDAN